jgi:hypothetical protein
MSNLNVINTLSHTLTDSELTEAIGILVDARKERQAGTLLAMKNTLRTGDTVEFYVSNRGCYVRGTVKKVKTKKALVVEEGHHINARHMTWDVPMGMLKKV